MDDSPLKLRLLLLLLLPFLYLLGTILVDLCSSL